MNWDDVKSFLAVARAQTLSGAGAQLKLDPATLGRRVTRLEDALGKGLFTKSPQGYVLTPEGLRLLPHAEKLEAVMADAQEDLLGNNASMSGQVRIGAPDGSANFILPQVCTEIARAHPGLDIQIVALPRLFNLSKREADMAIMVSRPEAGRLTVQKLSDYKLHLAASEAYLERSAPITALTDLKSHPIVGYIQDMIFDQELDYLGPWAERVALASNSVSVQAQAIRQGAGVGVVHDFVLPVLPGVRKILTDQFSLTRSFYLVRHEDDRKRGRLTEFAEALSAGVRREVSRLEAMT